MICRPMDVLKEYEIRKTKKEKRVFLDAAQTYFRKLGYKTSVEDGYLGAKNLVVGVPSTADFLITAHYDTCASMPFPNFITPCNFWTYLAYQLLIVLGFFLCAIFIGLLFAIIIPNTVLAQSMAIAAYWVLLFLLFFGPANLHTANDNTSGVVAVFEIAEKLSEGNRAKVCFVLFDLEEAGLFGSAGYRSNHKQETDRQIVLNLDCVGDGDEILFFPNKKVKADASKMNLLKACNNSWEDKSIRVWENGFSFYPSDQANFPYGVGICALKRGKIGLYMDKIHTKKDVTLDENNIDRISDALIQMIEIDLEEK